MEPHYPNRHLYTGQLDIGAEKTRGRELATRPDEILLYTVLNIDNILRLSSGDNEAAQLTNNLVRNYVQGTLTEAFLGKKLITDIQIDNHYQRDPYRNIRKERIKNFTGDIAKWWATGAYGSGALEFDQLYAHALDMASIEGLFSEEEYQAVLNAAGLEIDRSKGIHKDPGQMGRHKITQTVEGYKEFMDELHFQEVKYTSLGEKSRPDTEKGETWDNIYTQMVQLQNSMIEIKNKSKPLEKPYKIFSIMKHKLSHRDLILKGYVNLSNPFQDSIEFVGPATIESIDLAGIEVEDFDEFVEMLAKVKKQTPDTQQTPTAQIDDSKIVDLSNSFGVDEGIVSKIAVTVNALRAAGVPDKKIVRSLSIQFHPDMHPDDPESYTQQYKLVRSLFSSAT